VYFSFIFLDKSTHPILIT